MRLPHATSGTIRIANRPIPALPRCALAGLALLLGLRIAAAAVDPFAEGVRPTDPLTPAQQQATFHLPPGFEIQLVASEPDIAKPMNMAFDAKGRLWVSSSYEYPFPAPPGKPARDSIKVLSDFDATGRARKIETFADGLNIPIGLYPYKNGVIAWSIPNIWYFEDTDGDGKSDRREILFGPLGWERDTHGNQASFRRGFDGWLYGTHGFNNNSTFKARDGSTITLNSGNTWRVRVDGSRVEQHTWGQVNPFGLCLDPLGNFYSADCHSSPIYQLLRGGYYPSFGKPHDGLGFAPVLMEHAHGSTAIAGIVVYMDTAWPDEDPGNIFVGNVMTSRVNRDRMEFTGSSPTALEMPDLVSTDDPWFRPVDLQLAPDGALYIADFYNRIIGHYEVPLMHPGRDRERGRIWRLVYRGTARTPQRPPSLAIADDMGGLIRELASANPGRRLLALNELVDRRGPAAVDACRRAFRRARSPDERACLLWALHRFGALDIAQLRRAAADADRTVRTHAMRVLAETGEWQATHRELGLAGLDDASPDVRRAAAEALALHPQPEYAAPLLKTRLGTPQADTHLTHVLRMALRNQLQTEGSLLAWQSKARRPEEAKAIADVALGIKTTEAGSYVLDHLEKSGEQSEFLLESLRHAARFAPEQDIGRLARLVQSKFQTNLDEQLALFRATREGATLRGTSLPPALGAWATTLVERLLEQSSTPDVSWSNEPVPGLASTANPWMLQKRPSAGSDATSEFLCSLPPGGEQLTGRLLSPVFAAPASLTFHLAGHDGFPDKPPQRRNVVRVRDAATGGILAEAWPPRNDLAQPMVLDLGAHAGRPVRIEVVDGDDGSAYAWLAVGRFDPQVLRLPDLSPRQSAERQQAAAVLVRELQLKQFQPRLAGMLKHQQGDLSALGAVAETLGSFSGREELVALAVVMGDAATPPGVRSRVAASLADGTVDPEMLPQVMRESHRRLQIAMALRLTASPRGAGLLLDLVEQGKAPARLLVEPALKPRLSAALPASLKTKAEDLTRNVPASNDESDRLVAQRRLGFASAKPDAREGARLFKENCSNCHQRRGEGALVGPQLDGIESRGVDRLIEDILDPNRNVDTAFRSHIFVLTDGEVASGLPRREEGGSIVIADSTGKESVLPKSRIASSRESDISLMPGNLGEILTADQLNHLLGFLLEK